MFSRRVVFLSFSFALILSACPSMNGVQPGDSSDGDSPTTQSDPNGDPSSEREPTSNVDGSNEILGKVVFVAPSAGGSQVGDSDPLDDPQMGGGGSGPAGGPGNNGGNSGSGGNGGNDPGSGSGGNGGSDPGPDSGGSGGSDPDSGSDDDDGKDSDSGSGDNSGNDSGNDGNGSDPDSDSDSGSGSDDDDGKDSGPRSGGSRGGGGRMGFGYLNWFSIFSNTAQANAEPTISSCLVRVFIADPSGLEIEFEFRGDNFNDPNWNWKGKRESVEAVIPEDFETTSNLSARVELDGRNCEGGLTPSFEYDGLELNDVESIPFPDAYVRRQGTRFIINYLEFREGLGDRAFESEPELRSYLGQWADPEDPSSENEMGRFSF